MPGMDLSQRHAADSVHAMHWFGASNLAAISMALRGTTGFIGGIMEGSDDHYMGGEFPSPARETCILSPFHTLPHILTQHVIPGDP